MNNTNSSRQPKSELRYSRLGQSDLWVSPVALGCWPMSGISTLGATREQSIATVHAAIDAGINHFDTAYSYGYAGESDSILCSVLESRADTMVIASKVGTHYDTNRQRILDASPERLTAQAEEICRRLKLDRIDLLYLHTPDGVTPIESSAHAMAKLVDRQLVRYVGLSNVDVELARRFSSVIRPIVVQPPFNMLQQSAVAELRPFLEEYPCGVAAYWPLMKGLLAGGMQRDHVLAANDKRRTYEIFQGAAWNRAQDLLDVLRSIAFEQSLSVAQLVVHWTMRQPFITTVLCGAKRPAQIVDSAGAMRVWLDEPTMQRIDREVQRQLALTSAE